VALVFAMLPQNPFTTSVPSLSALFFSSIPLGATKGMYARTGKEASRGKETEGERWREEERRGEEESEKETHKQQEKREGCKRQGEKGCWILRLSLLPVLDSFFFSSAVTVCGFNSFPIPFAPLHTLSSVLPLFPPDLLLVSSSFSCECFLPWLPRGFGPFFFLSPSLSTALFPRSPLSLSLSPFGVSPPILLAPLPSPPLLPAIFPCSLIAPV